MAIVFCLTLRLTTVTKEGKQHIEEVDEVEVEGERAIYGSFPHGFTGESYVVRGFDSLGVVCGESCKDEDADDGDGEVEHGALHEEVDDGGDDDAEESHHEEASES